MEGQLAGGAGNPLTLSSFGVSRTKLRSLEMAPSEVSRLVHELISLDRLLLKPMMLIMARPMAPRLVVWVNWTAKATCRTHVSYLFLP